MITIRIPLPTDHVAIGLHAEHEFGSGKPIRGACRMVVQTIVRTPKRWSKERRRRHNWATKEPAMVSAVAVVTRGLKGVVYADDKQIVELVCSKRYGQHDAVIVTVEPLDAEARDWAANASAEMSAMESA